MKAVGFLKSSGNRILRTYVVVLRVIFRVTLNFDFNDSFVHSNIII
jgi:hypothetical protein